MNYEKPAEAAKSEKQADENNVEVAGKKAFIEALKGWMRTPDGEDLCPDCWEAYLLKFDPSFAETVRKDSHDTSAYLSTLKTGTEKKSDGWYATCSGSDCWKTVSASRGD